MKKTVPSRSDIVATYDAYAKRVSKLPCGRSKYVPSYGIVTAYRAKNGKRRMSVCVCWGEAGIKPAGNYKAKTVVDSIRRYGEIHCRLLLTPSPALVGSTFA